MQSTSTAEHIQASAFEVLKISNKASKYMKVSLFKNVFVDGFVYSKSAEAATRGVPCKKKFLRTPFLQNTSGRLNVQIDFHGHMSKFLFFFLYGHNARPLAKMLGACLVTKYAINNKISKYLNIKWWNVREKSIQSSLFINSLFNNFASLAVSSL